MDTITGSQTMKNNPHSEGKKVIHAAFMAALAAAVTLPLQGCNEEVPVAESFDATPGATKRTPVEELDADVQEATILGGRLYDNWFSEVGVGEPAGENPMGKFIPGYPTAEPYLTFKGLDPDKQYRCKTCHGFEYTGSEFFPVGIMDAPDNMSPDQMQALIRDGFSLSFGSTTGTVTVHNFGALGLTDDAISQLTDFIQYGVVNVEDYLYPFSPTYGAIGRGDVANGLTLFSGKAECKNCHGANGKLLDFDDGDTTTTPNEFVGTIGQEDPAEMLHKIRFGQAGDDRMPNIYENGLTTQDAVDIMTYTQKLPAQ